MKCEVVRLLARTQGIEWHPGCDAKAELVVSKVPRQHRETARLVGTSEGLEEEFHLCPCCAEEFSDA